MSPRRLIRISWWRGVLHTGRAWAFIAVFACALGYAIQTDRQVRQIDRLVNKTNRLEAANVKLRGALVSETDARICVAVNRIVKNDRETFLESIRQAQKSRTLLHQAGIPATVIDRIIRESVVRSRVELGKRPLLRCGTLPSSELPGGGRPK